jgi:methylated-DNA-[protein]-cysteine S-methyltransferase
MADTPTLFVDILKTPLGQMELIADENGWLRASSWVDRDKPRIHALRRQALVPTRNPFGYSQSLAAYFAGELDTLDAVPVAPDGTSFQRSVWAALRQIPCGTTLSYGQLALKLGNPAAVRAVGLANGANPIGIVVPCHRVIGADGSLTGFGGGLERKRWLLEHESALPQAELRLGP